jgi:uncharacterized cysteine cluster protein YcgN (CxxCxxCC family)
MSDEPWEWLCEASGHCSVTLYDSKFAMLNRDATKYITVCMTLDQSLESATGVSPLQF